MMADSFLWHDFETFGADPRRDRPCQFAALRTDAELNPIDKPLVLYCQPADDLLPQPMACLITGITPQLARQRGLVEPEFAAAISEQMSQPGTCSVGYNNFRFDDEVTRFLLWRNFHDPYAREYANGNSRFDLIDVMRMTRALRPEGINWPDRDDGSPSFRLEDLAAANGLDTSRAHDALADVEATLDLARRMRQHQPRLWSWALELRAKHRVAALLEQRHALVHSSARFPAAQLCTAPILPLSEHPFIRSQWLTWNLRHDPQPFLDVDSDLLTELLWTPEADLPDGYRRLPVKIVRTNRCPMLAPMNVLDEPALERLDLDPDLVERHRRKLIEHPEFIKRLVSLLDRPDAGSAIDPELDLYSSFIPRQDQPVMARVREAEAAKLAGMDKPFADERLNTMLFRYRARWWPETLSTEERERWQAWRRRRLVDDPELASIQLPEYRAEVAELARRAQAGADLLRDLAGWPGEIGIDAWRSDAGEGN